MLPVLQAGDQILVNPGAYRHSLPKVGDLVVAQHPEKADLRIVKRVALVFEDSCFLEGDNPQESTDSRSFGCVPLGLLLGCVTSRLP
jgi:nickel-type superoxide dismutase maturation protease